MQAVNKLLVLCMLAFLTAFSCNTPRQASNKGTVPNRPTRRNTDTYPSPTGGTTHFGALIGPPGPRQNAIGFKEQVARQLNIQYLRDNINLDSPKAHTLLETGFNVVLNINSSAPRKGKHTPFTTDTVAYKRRLSAILSSLPKKPALVVIENEANNQNYYSGSAQDYINLLRAAIGVVHAYNIPVTDAGTTGAAVKYLLYQHYMQNGMRQQAEALRQRQGIRAGRNVIESAAFADSVLTALRILPVDYVNMHWYQNTTNTQDLEAAVNYLKQRTGKAVISNEIGESDKPDPDVVAAMLRACKQMQLPYVIWYSGTSTTGARAQALHTSNGTLNINGQAFKKAL